MMELNEFVNLFADQFDDTDPAEITADTYFRELEEWSSLTGLAILNAVSKKCNVSLTPAELRSCETVQEVYDLVQSK